MNKQNTDHCQLPKKNWSTLFIIRLTFFFFAVNQTMRYWLLWWFPYWFQLWHTSLTENSVTTADEKARVRMNWDVCREQFFFRRVFFCCLLFIWMGLFFLSFLAFVQLLWTGERKNGIKAALPFNTQTFEKRHHLNDSACGFFFVGCFD